MTVGFDLDDVLLNFNDVLLQYYNTIYGTKHERKHRQSYELSEMWNCTREDAIQRMSDFYSSSAHWNAPPVDGAVERIRKLKQHHNLFVITAKPEELKDRTSEWLDKHFPQMFDGVHFTNHYQGDGPKRSKGEVCKELGIEIFVDDFLHNVEDVANLGIPALLFDAPWNQGEVKPPITRVYSWDEIVEILVENVA
ncbi:MAG: HAD hydrolase-like protein [bacterium]|nr:HAD hydrolase-like protein [bacterium]